MFVIRKYKNLIALIMIVFSFAINVSSANYEVPSEIQSYGEDVYSRARSYFGGRSFNGYCGTYIRCQLRAMGIFDDQFDFRGNGNQWYSNFENVDKTSGGYYVYREEGADCLEKLIRNYGNNLSNIVLSFPIQSGYSAQNPGAGHALVIYKVSGTTAYYSESFGFGKYSEGEVIAEDIYSLTERYAKRHGEAIGCVLLSKDTLTAGNYFVSSYEVAPEILLGLKNSLDESSNVMFIAEQFVDVSQNREA